MAVFCNAIINIIQPLIVNYEYSLQSFIDKYYNGIYIQGQHFIVTMKAKYSFQYYTKFGIWTVQKALNR
jgi:hypothetical protein